MHQRTIIGTEFWSDPYLKKLPPHGKIAFCYAKSFERENKPISFEDMAAAIGQDISVCEDWLEQFAVEHAVSENWWASNG